MNLYKKIYVFAATEIKAGYGTSTIDTLIESQYGDVVEIGILPPFANTAPTTGNIFYAGLTPSIGADFLFNRISFGTEIALNIVTFSTASYNNQPRKNTINWDMGNFNPRFFVHYRF